MKQRIVLTIKYLIFLTAVCFLHLYNSHMVTFMILIMTVLFPVLSIIWFYSSVKKMEEKIGFERNMINRNQSVNLLLCIKNNSYYPVTRLQWIINVKHNFISNDIQHEYTLDVPAHSERIFTIPLTFGICGCYNASSISLTLWDFTGFASKKIILQSNGEIVVLPQKVSLKEEPDLVQKDKKEEEIIESLEVGHDPTEIIHIREYRQGDRLQSIHWKLSAKEQKLMSKELAHITGNSFRLFIDYNFQNIRHLDTFFDLLYSLSLYLLEKKINFRITWSVSSGQAKPWLEITDESKLIEALLKLFYEKPGQNTSSLTLNPASDEEYSDILLLTTRPYRNDSGEQVMLYKGIVRIYRINRN